MRATPGENGELGATTRQLVDNWELPKPIAPYNGRTFNPPNAKRHKLQSVRYSSSAAKEKNSVAEPGLFAEDMKAIQHGLAEVKGNILKINGRTYAVEGSGTLFPIEGPGIHSLTHSEFKALGAINQYGEGTQAFSKVVANDPTITPAALERARAARAALEGVK